MWQNNVEIKSIPITESKASYYINKKFNKIHLLSFYLKINLYILEMNKIRVLFRGWTQIPHSYAMVNCFQLVHLHKNYKDKLEIYIEEMEYFRKEWNNNKKLVYPDEYNEIINNFKTWKGEEVDMIYSITYPYNIKPGVINNSSIPKCVFYTSEFATLFQNYFVQDSIPVNSDNDVFNHVKLYHNIYYTTPSVWSSNGMKKYGVVDYKNRIITHGVDTNIFKKLENEKIRQKMRDFYKIKNSDILLLNIGAMTKNKGICLILESLHMLVNVHKKSNYKLLLKGMGDLYETQLFLECYFDEFKRNGIMTKDDIDNLLNHHIIFTSKTLSYEQINNLFNSADLYLSPYLAEGFNLTVLESLASGLSVLVPETGSTREFVNDIKNNGGGNYVNYVKSEIVELGMGAKENRILKEDIVDSILNRKIVKDNGEYKTMKNYIEEMYSWNKVSELLYNYFGDIINKRQY